MSITRRFFGEFDMFSAPPLLRAKQEDKTTSLCSGVISFLLALFFSYVFINSATAVITFNKIDSVQTQSRLNFQSPVAQQLFFAIRVGYLPFLTQQKYFQIGFFVVGEDGQNITYKVQQCLPEQWKKIGSDFQNQYTRFNLQQFFCPKPEDYFTLKKVYYALNSQFCVIFIKPCLNYINQLCQEPLNQQQFIRQLSQLQGAIFIQIYFLDRAINPSSKQPIEYFTNTDAQFSFTTKRGIISTIQFSSFTVETDMSVFPVQDIKIVKGYTLHTFRETSLQILSAQDNFATIYLTMNRKHIFVERKVGKLDDMLSYVGGLFSIIIGFLAIFFSSFNKYRYQLMVAQGIFHQDEDGKAIKQLDFSFLLYIKYTIFDWISVLFCFQLKWEDCIIVDSTRDEANKQIDVTRLFRKIQSLQIAVNYMIGDKGLKDCLNLLKPVHLSQIIRNRLVLQYYNSIIQGQSSLNFEQFRLSHQILEFGLKILENESSQNPNKVNNMDCTQEFFPKSRPEIQYHMLQSKEYLLKVISLHFGQIANEAEKIELKDEKKLAQFQLSEAFFHLDQNQRSEMVQKIPIKILYRLAKCSLASEFSSQEGEAQILKRKKVNLYIAHPLVG